MCIIIPFKPFPEGSFYMVVENGVIPVGLKVARYAPQRTVQDMLRREHDTPNVIRREVINGEAYIARFICPEDTQQMIDGRWFEDPIRLAAFKGGAINRDTIPTEWNEQTRKKFKEEVLDPFYFPGGPFEVVAEKFGKTRSSVIRTIKDVERKTVVLQKKSDGTIIASRSFLTKDPWAGRIDWKKHKIAHFQMFVVAPGNEGAGIGTKLADITHNLAIQQGYTQFVTWVNLTPKSGENEGFFINLGYEEDRGFEGLLVLNPTVLDPKVNNKHVLSERIRMRKYKATVRDILSARDLREPLERA